MSETTQELANDIDKHLATQSPSEFMTTAGLEGIPTSLLGMPYVKVVQPMSDNVSLADGTDAAQGTFFFTDSSTATDSLDIALITAKKDTRMFERDGETKEVEQIGLLFQNRANKKIYVMSLSVTSFRSFGKLMGLIAAEEWDNAWEKNLTLTTEKRDRQGGGKYYVVNFAVGDSLSDEEAAEITALWLQYGGYFQHEVQDEEEVA